MELLHNPLVYHVGSGQAFFVGIAGLLLGLLISLVTGPKSRWLKLLRNLLVLVGGIWIAISACPLPEWLYAILGVVSATWLVLEWLGRTRVPDRLLVTARVGVAAACLLALGLELPYHFRPDLPALENPALFLIGDSVSAGMGGEKKPAWPRLLSERTGWSVRDGSQPGATAASASRQAEKLQDSDNLVLLEIGGNDVLGRTTPDNYAEALDRLLTSICRPGRTVVMLELPLPPFANAFGRAQRDLAAKHQVHLIPKRFFVTVLTTDGATVDGVHLSATGHELMADAMGEVFAGVKR